MCDEIVKLQAQSSTSRSVAICPYLNFHLELDQLHIQVTQSCPGQLSLHVRLVLLRLSSFQVFESFLTLHRDHYSALSSHSMQSFVATKNRILDVLGKYRTIPYRDSTTSRLASALSSVLLKRIVYAEYDRIVQSLSGMDPLESTAAADRIISSIINIICGGGLLIMPMVIMSFDTNRTKSLVTVSCSVILFGFVLGAVIRSKSSVIFVATATYAAVLVVFAVFVGISGSASG